MGVHGGGSALNKTAADFWSRPSKGITYQEEVLEEMDGDTDDAPLLRSPRRPNHQVQKKVESV